ncbi:MarR family transcriptional regulator [Ignavibacterium album JCM 16511]|uniref:MarR family transcriptional regulator n=1 Tax=Ignavibacterium album (strain DSM 19864 / JCM 16511 / NBRC 101810 / Mat9-16) TaxID=945713 RepID=I0AGV6_IGNAJ|nr:MarR family transcriptional regulator [Ignavibacterium album]AFH48213.1 MarR family transcriptional regulator [Ignavibacterium album JCM 16511]
MGSKFDGSFEQKNALNSFIKLFRASEILKSKISAITNSNGFSDGQFYVLDVLYHLGSLPQKTLAEKIMRTEGNITMIINNLLKRKAIKRIKSENDGRVHIISLTEKGKNEFEKIFPFVLKEIETMFASLTNEEKILLQNLCKKIGLSQKQ